MTGTYDFLPARATLSYPHNLQALKIKFSSNPFIFDNNSDEYSSSLIMMAPSSEN